MSDVAQSEHAAPREGAGQPDAAEHLLRMMFGYLMSSGLYAAASLRIADHLKEGPLSAGELARRTGADEDALYRVLRMLASAGLFHELDARTFQLTPPADFLRSDARGSLRDLVVWMTDPFHFRVYADLMHSVRTGRPAIEKTYSKPAFEYFREDRELSEVFNAAMTTISAMAIPAVLEAYDFSGIGTLVDVAGGHGEVLLSILERYPQMRGILFDLDHVVEGARDRIASRGLRERCEAVSGDFFVSVPAGGDAYLMKHIIHDWDDERAIAILRRIHRALEGRPRGRVMLLETVLAPANQPDFGKLADIEMLALPGGRERTEEEYAALFAQAGFRLSRVVPTQGAFFVVEAVRAE
jgi:hypothetical protein